jgi:hypothetical protein
MSRAIPLLPRKILEKYSNIKRTGITKTIVAFCNFANAPGKLRDYTSIIHDVIYRFIIIITIKYYLTLIVWTVILARGHRTQLPICTSDIERPAVFLELDLSRFFVWRN